MLGSSIASAQGAPAPAPCGAAKYHEFDFWAGRWNITQPDGTSGGVSWIEPILNGCAIVEHYGVNGNSGISLNFYDNEKKVWTQTWMGAGGHPLHLSGGMRGTSMVLEGESLAPGGVNAKNRITWTPMDGGRVDQKWEQSTDGGTTWKVVFDGVYAPAPAP